MPPKKKASKSGKGGKGSGGIIDGVSMTEMSREQLEAFAFRIRDELEREREERNFFQLERDKLYTFWEITRQQLEENKAELSNKDRAIEEAAERHDMEIKIYKQKVKHLMYDHHSHLAELKANNMVTLKMAENDYSEQEIELEKDKKALKAQLVEICLSHEDEIKALRLKHSTELSELRGKFAAEAEVLENKMDARLATLRNQLNLKHKLELAEVEERKNQQIQHLVNNHHQAFSELKAYYNDITVNNLALITSLKEQMAKMKDNEERIEKKLKEVSNENKKLTEPLKEAREQVADLQRQLTNYNKDKVSLSNMKKHLSHVTKQLEDLNGEYDVLEMAFEKVKGERDELHDKFVSAILELQQKSSLKNVVLEKKLEVLTAALEQRDVQVAEVMAATNIDPKAMHSVNKKLEELLASKNNRIQELQLEVARVLKAHDDMVLELESRLKTLGISSEDVGLQTKLRPRHKSVHSSTST
ncbi:dynein regulatory complex subunit 4-like [Macrosteles quadrilineatus]|uniref:dynein regulatory complex subunit 4-like n=1 Tax=Macrosteles quadrilineatus TaxID=74068 RepID=UPI0023E259B1|nr:dynein regulatory complex subunit 4-like [Macrosteles quadrilineatus]